MAAAMVGKTIGRAIKEGTLPVNVERFGRSKDEIFVTAASLREQLGSRAFEVLPAGAIGLYTYFERLAQGLRQIMAGSRKFSTRHIARQDVAALDREVAALTGIPHVTDVDREQVEEILAGA
jgi:hypothetical protein